MAKKRTGEVGFSTGEAAHIAGPIWRLSHRVGVAAFALHRGLGLSQGEAGGALLTEAGGNDQQRGE